MRRSRPGYRLVKMCGYSDTKWKYVNETRDQVKDFERQYMDGLITGEKNIIRWWMHGQNVQIWSQMQ